MLTDKYVLKWLRRTHNWRWKYVLLVTKTAAILKTWQNNALRSWLPSLPLLYKQPIKKIDINSIPPESLGADQPLSEETVDSGYEIGLVKNLSNQLNWFFPDVNIVARIDSIFVLFWINYLKFSTNILYNSTQFLPLDQLFYSRLHILRSGYFVRNGMPYLHIIN